MGSSSLIDVLAVHADRLDEWLPLQRRSGLITALTAVPDRRDLRGIVHALPAVLATAVAAVLTGARSAPRRRLPHHTETPVDLNAAPMKGCRTTAPYPIIGRTDVNLLAVLLREVVGQSGDGWPATDGGGKPVVVGRSLVSRAGSP